MNCVLCGIECEGSIGPASGYLRPLCDPHAMAADGEVMRVAVEQSRQMDRIMDILVNPKPLIELEGLQ